MAKNLGDFTVTIHDSGNWLILTHDACLEETRIGNNFYTTVDRIIWAVNSHKCPEITPPLTKT